MSLHIFPQPPEHSEDELFLLGARRELLAGGRWDLVGMGVHEELHIMANRAHHFHPGPCDLCPYPSGSPLLREIAYMCLGNGKP